LVNFSESGSNATPENAGDLGPKGESSINARAYLVWEKLMVSQASEYKVLRHSLLERWRYQARLFQVLFGILTGLSGNLFTNIAFASPASPRDMYVFFAAISFVTSGTAFAIWGWLLEDARDAALLLGGSPQTARDYLRSEWRPAFYHAVQGIAVLSLVVGSLLFTLINLYRS